MEKLTIIKDAYYPSVEFGLVGPMIENTNGQNKEYYPWLGSTGKKIFSFTDDGFFDLMKDKSDKNLDLSKPMRKDGTPWFQNDEIDDSLYQQYKHLKLNPGHKWVLVKYDYDSKWYTRVFTSIGKRESCYYCVVDTSLCHYKRDTDIGFSQCSWRYMKEFIPNEDKIVKIELTEDEVRKVADIDSRQLYNKSLKNLISKCYEWVEKNPIKKRVPWNIEEKVKWCLENKNLYGAFYINPNECLLIAQADQLSIKNLEAIIQFKEENSKKVTIFEKEI